MVCEKLRPSFQSKSKKGYDAIDEKTGIRYQIKARRLTVYNRSRQLSVIRNLDQKLFDYLIAVFFDELFNLAEMWKVPQETTPKHARYSPHQNGHILTLTGEVLEDEMVTRLFSRLDIAYKQVKN